MARPYFDVAGYQARLDAICGTNRERKSIVRLVWCPEVEQWALGERTPRYWISRSRSEGDWQYEQPHRWALEKRIERPAYYEAHNAGRWFTNEHGQVLDLGEPPEEYYTTFHKIAVHDKFHDRKTGEPWCCARKYEEDRQVCWGLEGEAGYRAPDEVDLQLVEAAVRRMEAEPFYNPYEPLSREQLIAIELQATHDVQRIEEEKAQASREQRAEFNHVMNNVLHTSRSFPTNVKAARKRYENITGGYTKQGAIYVPENN